MLLGLGTARDQWREAGIELHLGRISAQELHELGERIIRGEGVEENYEIVRLRRQVWDLEDDVSTANSEYDDERSKRYDAESKAESLEAENADLKAKVDELERTIRGLQQGG